MRYTPINQVKSEMILGQEIHDASGRLLLSKHLKLTEENISYIAFLGIPGVYIDDKFVKEVEIEEIVKPEIRQTAVSLVQNLFLTVAEGELPNQENEIKKNVEEIVNNVLENEDVMYNLIELKTYDDYTYFHSANVAILAGVIGAKCGLTKQELEDIVISGFLHDIGKVFIDPNIINAPRRLTEEERLKMMAHPRSGYEFLVENYHFSERVLRAVYEHHEWVNGMGYPCHKKEDELLLNSKILKAADVYDAMTSRRSYHAPYLPGEVLEYIMGRSGMEFDTQIVQVMTNELCVYPLGCEVELSDSTHAIVIKNHRGFVLRPTIKLLTDGRIMNLTTDRTTWNLTITKLMM